MENLDPPPPNKVWENGTFLPFAQLHPWFGRGGGGGGEGGLLFHFILSKIAAFTENFNNGHLRWSKRQRVLKEMVRADVS